MNQLESSAVVQRKARVRGNWPETSEVSLLRFALAPHQGDIVFPGRSEDAQRSSRARAHGTARRTRISRRLNSMSNSTRAREIELALLSEIAYFTRLDRGAGLAGIVTWRLSIGMKYRCTNRGEVGQRFRCASGATFRASSACLFGLASGCFAPDLDGACRVACDLGCPEEWSCKNDYCVPPHFTGSCATGGAEASSSG